MERTSPTQHSITRSLVSLAHETSGGNNSVQPSLKMTVDANKARPRACDHFGDGCLWKRKVLIRHGQPARLAIRHIYSLLGRVRRAKR